MWTPIDGRILDVPSAIAEIRRTIFTPVFRPSGGVLHNTSTPNLMRSRDYSIEHWRDMWVGFYRDTQGWSAGPHFFCFPDRVLLFTPLNHRGTHSPSWNGTKFGVEMVADFDIEDDESGGGLAEKEAAVAVFATIYAMLGLDPEGIRMHYEDPRTTHACPGKHIEKAAFIAKVTEYMGHGGEHPPAVPEGPPPAQRQGIVAVPDGETLNVRENSSASSNVVEKLRAGAGLTILGQASNGSTSWLRVRTSSSTVGWAAERFVKS